MNQPGVLAEINQVLLDDGVNVVAQNLATLGEQGYVVTDVATAPSEGALAQLGAMPPTIWLRTHS